jgi:hypothetical protein
LILSDKYKFILITDYGVPTPPEEKICFTATENSKFTDTLRAQLVFERIVPEMSNLKKKVFL